MLQVCMDLDKATVALKSLELIHELVDPTLLTVQEEEVCSLAIGYLRQAVRATLPTRNGNDIEEVNK